MKKIPKFKEKNRWRAIKIVGTQEKGVGTSDVQCHKHKIGTMIQHKAFYNPL